MVGLRNSSLKGLYPGLEGVIGFDTILSSFFVAVKGQKSCDDVQMLLAHGVNRVSPKREGVASKKGLN